MAPLAAGLVLVKSANVKEHFLAWAHTILSCFDRQTRVRLSAVNVSGA